MFILKACLINFLFLKLFQFMNSVTQTVIGWIQTAIIEANV